MNKRQKLNGEKIRQWEKEKCVTRAFITRELGVSPSYVSKLLTGERAPTKEIITTLAKVTRLEKRDLLLPLKDKKAS